MDNVHSEYKAEIIADSVVKLSGCTHRCTTFVIEFARIVLAELNTHRLFSRNSASSRAIPAKRMLAFVKERPFVPNRFPLNHKGMQSDTWVYPGSEEYEEHKQRWLAARDIAVEISEEMNKGGMSKQLTNRILEPFLMHRVIVTATEWGNFFALRVDESAQNEIQIIATMMLQAMNNSTPTELQPGGWHLPFGDQLDEAQLQVVWQQLKDDPNIQVPKIEDLKIAIAIARCARVSYLNFKGKDDYIADVKLFQRLAKLGHMSPFEHAAKAMTEPEYRQHSHTFPNRVELGWCGNFRGFIQFRKMFPPSQENRIDTRLK